MLYCFVQAGKTGLISKTQSVQVHSLKSLWKALCFQQSVIQPLRASISGHMAKNDLPGYIAKTAQQKRLQDKGLDDCIRFCITPDFTEKIPVIKNGILVEINFHNYFTIVLIWSEM